MTLLRRLFSAIILLGTSGLLLFKLPSILGVVVVMVLAVLALLEFYNIQKNSGIPAFRNIGIVSGVAILASAYVSLNVSTIIGPAAPDAWRELPGLVVTMIVFIIFVRQFPQKENPQPLPTIACTMLGLVYLPLMLMFMMHLCFRWTPTSWNMPFSPTARAVILYLIVVVKASDVGAYLVGSTCGRHKMFPRISPGKTWEGLAGGFITGILASLALFWLWHNPSPESHTAELGRLTITFGHALFLGAFLAAIGVIGDLVESLLKRSAGLKDSGCIFPGMGGILDVIDSLLFAAPALYFYLRWFAHVI
ncbi:MAG: phosphatidate cytidylyltransferase [bacterium]|jgi:phosphatidate cytidylyltransferase